MRMHDMCCGWNCEEGYSRGFVAGNFLPCDCPISNFNAQNKTRYFIRYEQKWTVSIHFNKTTHCHIS